MSIGNPISKDRSKDEYLLEKVESIIIGEVELLGNILLDEACQWNNNVRAVEDKLAIKISKT